MATSTPSAPMAQSDVMVRAYGDEPVRMKVLESGPDSTLVAREAGAPSIGFPSSLVYAFDAALYAELRRVYEAGDSETLRGLWKNARR